VSNIGSPVVESVREVAAEAPPLERFVPPGSRALLCTYHPIGTEPERAGAQFEALAAALREVRRRSGVSVVLTFPNNEPGSEAIVAELERLRGQEGFHVHENLGWRNYLGLMSRCALVVGNSSSGLLEAPIVGVPTLDVGTRQRGRLAPASVSREESYDPARLASRMLELLAAQRRPVEHPYGDGRASLLAWETLSSVHRARSRSEILRKRMTY
jgi:UDP-N-acetylglucosamine 2-epimerase